LVSLFNFVYQVHHILIIWSKTSNHQTSDSILPPRYSSLSFVFRGVLKPKRHIKFRAGGFEVYLWLCTIMQK